MDGMTYAKEAGKLIKNGPKDDDPSLLKTMAGVVLHWRMWAGVFTVYAGLYALTFFTGEESPLVAGWMVGFFTAFVAMMVMHDD